jgi:phage gpG-like protein
MANKFKLDQVIGNLKQVKSDLPLQLANTTKNFFIKKNFGKQQFNGKKWEDVQRRGGKSKRSNSAILVQTGRLRRAVANSLKSATFYEIEFNVTEATAKAGFNYASVHNYGYKGAVKAYSRKRGGKNRRKRGKINVGAHDTDIPQRQFMGQSAALTKVQLKKVRQVVDKIFN